MSLVETEAIVLRSYKLAEADKIVICLTKDSGLVRGVARGARRLKSRFGASLESFTLASVCFFVKEGRELVSFKHAEIIRSYFGLAQDAEAFAGMDYMCGLAFEFAPPHEPNETLFRMTRACLDALADSPAQTQAVARYFEVWLLKLAGFSPDVRACASCRRRFDEREPLYLNAESVLRCGHCSAGQGLRISGEAGALWRKTSKLSPGEWAATARNSPAAAHKELKQLAQNLIGRALERAPRAQFETRARGSVHSLQAAPADQ